MPTNPLLVTVSVVYGVGGLALLFAPDVIMSQVATGVPPVAIWIAGMFGGALVAMSLLNWFSRQSLIGGIYGRPLLLANLMLLSNITFSSLRLWRAQPAPLFAVVTVLGAVFVIAFGRLLFRTPAAVGRPPAP
ncbi:MAG: hypothetical protein U5K74_12530 [Gemmatimonadaceae bacterium]|nr:hypothetical protein [Gemmatimonadaceae bacterium]